ncbi:MAG: DoxX family protein [Planctomycetia bacterium]|nr:DoxX family protein [Planctomycetia bacterium]
MGKKKYYNKAATLIIMLLVIMRIGIGWHFFFEGLWKMEPSNGFSSKGFLGMAKGPTKDLYYMMLPDLQGDERLEMAKVYEVKQPNGIKESQKKLGWTFPVIEREWFNYYEEFKSKYCLSDEQIAATDIIFNQYVDSLREYTAENRDDILGFLGSKQRFEADKISLSNKTEHQKIRNWDNQMKYRSEAEKFLSEPETMGENMQLALWEELNGQQKAQSAIAPIAYGQNKIPFANVIANTPFIKNFATPSRLGFLDLAVTLGLSAIGVCLMIGFCTRLAALGGAVFMLNVCLSQFPWPTVYPYSPEVVGHFMIFSKDSAELMALLVLAAVPVGRWGGLDWFLWNFGGKQIMRLYGWKNDPLTPAALAPDC